MLQATWQKVPKAYHVLTELLLIHSLKHGVELEQPGLAAVNLGSQLKPSWFPPEKLIIMPYQIYRRAVPSSLTGSMLKIACNGPAFNRGLIEGEGMNMLLLNRANRPDHVSRASSS